MISSITHLLSFEDLRVFFTKDTDFGSMYHITLHWYHCFVNWWIPSTSFVHVNILCGLLHYKYHTYEQKALQVPQYELKYNRITDVPCILVVHCQINGITFHLILWLLVVWILTFSLVWTSWHRKKEADWYTTFVFQRLEAIDFLMTFMDVWRSTIRCHLYNG